jgi:hypothetical protein
MPGIKMEKDDSESTVEKPQVAVKQPLQAVPVDAMMGYFPITDLPSKYKLYPEGTMIHGRPLGVLEVKQLSQMSENNSNIIINGILKSATRGIKVEDLLIADKIYILFWLRANTYKDSGYKVDFKCLKCEKDSTYSFTLDALQITYIKDDYIDGTPFELPISKDKIILRFQTIKDVTEVENFKSKVQGNRLEEYDDDILTLASKISVNEKIMSLKQKYDYIIALNAGDYAMLDSTDTEREIGVSQVVNVKCGLCGQISYAGLSFRPEFFVPKYKT